MIGAAIPILSKVAQFLPLATATLGALPGLREGDPVKAAAGAGLGYLGGRFAKGKAGVTRAEQLVLQLLQPQHKEPQVLHKWRFLLLLLL